jgi:AcrR family transcriptional regulator
VARYRAGIETEGKIIAATRELLGDVGLEGTTLKAICDTAEVRAGSFYNLFDSKEEVVLRVVGEAINAVDPDPEGLHTDTVEDLVEAHIAFITGDPAVARIYLQIAVGRSQSDSTIGNRFLRHHRRRFERFADAMRRAEPALEATEVAARTEILLATLNGLAFHWFLEPTFDFAAHARRVVQ